MYLTLNHIRTVYTFNVREVNAYNVINSLLLCVKIDSMTEESGSKASNECL